MAQLMSLCVTAKTQCNQRNKRKTLFKDQKNKLQIGKKQLQIACLTKDCMFRVYMKHIYV